MASTHLKFENFTLDQEGGRLLKDGQEIKLRRQSYEMLLLLVKNPGKLISKEDLLEKVWGNTLVTDNSIPQCLKEIRQAIGDTEHKKIRTIPRRGVILELEVQSVDSGNLELVQPSSGRRGVLLGTLAVAVVVLLLLTMLNREGSDSTKTDFTDSNSPHNNIAVLPFVVMDPSHDYEYFAEGLSEEIINELAQIPDLLVVARTSSFRFGAVAADIRTIGEQLSTSHILEGSVRVESETIRVTAQLIDAQTGAHIWSEAYDASLNDVFQVQQEIASKVVQSMPIDGLVPFAKEDVYTPDPEAYRLVIQGQMLLQPQTADNVKNARELFAGAAQLDPDFALAWVRLAATVRVQYLRYSLPRDEFIGVGLVAAQRALELDPENAEVQIRASNYAGLMRDPESSRRHRQRALELAPNNTLVLAVLAGHAMSRGDTEAAVRLMQQVVELDPMSPGVRNIYALFLHFSDQPSQSREQAEIAQNLVSQPDPETDLLIAKNWLLEGELAKAMAIINKMPGGRLQNIGFALLGNAPGHESKSIDAIAMLEYEATPRSAIALAEIHAFLDERERAFHWLETVSNMLESMNSVMLTGSEIGHLRVSPLMKNLHEDARWADLLDWIQTELDRREG